MSNDITRNILSYDRISTNDRVITYNPYKYDSFVNKETEEPVYSANEIDMINTQNKIFHINEIVG